MSEKKYMIENATLMAEWDWEKNKKLGLYPQKITHASTKLVFFLR